MNTIIIDKLNDSNNNKEHHAILSSHDFINNQFIIDHTIMSQSLIINQRLTEIIETKHICLWSFSDRLNTIYWA